MRNREKSTFTFYTLTKPLKRRKRRSKRQSRRDVGRYASLLVSAAPCRSPTLLRHQWRFWVWFKQRKAFRRRPKDLTSSAGVHINRVGHIIKLTFTFWV